MCLVTLTNVPNGPSYPGLKTTNTVLWIFNQWQFLKKTRTAIFIITSQCKVCGSGAGSAIWFSFCVSWFRRNYQKILKLVTCWYYWCYFLQFKSKFLVISFTNFDVFLFHHHSYWDKWVLNWWVHGGSISAGLLILLIKIQCCKDSAFIEQKEHHTYGEKKMDLLWPSDECSYIKTVLINTNTLNPFFTL